MPIGWLFGQFNPRCTNEKCPRHKKQMSWDFKKKIYYCLGCGQTHK